MMLRFRLLGTVEVRRDDVVVPVPPGMLRSLLTCLLLRANQPVPADSLAGWLWDTTPPHDARTTLRGYVMRLRRALEAGGAADRLVRSSGGYLIRVHDGELDLHEFHGLVRRARASVDLEEQAELWREALALWRGEPLSDVSAERLVREVVPVFLEQRTEAHENRIEADLRLGRHTAVIGELRELVRENPLRERFWAQLMRAQALSGRQADALASYRTVHAYVRDELGVEPSAELRDLHRAVLAGDLAAPVPESDPTPVPAQLPAEVFGFCGREELLATLDAQLPDEQAGSCPIVVLSGPAGAGKTALAVHWAHLVRDRFPDGQLYVDLRGYSPDEPVDPAQALAWLLRSLGAVPPPDLTERSALLRTLLDRKRMLVVLDNAHTAEQVRPLLPGSASCLVLVTSRDVLAGLVARDGARRIDVGVLSSGEALRLLRTLLGAQVDTHPAAAHLLLQQCAGLPLALRVAAESVADRADAGLAGAVDGLDSHWRDAGDESVTVHTVFSWSLRHLAPRERDMFRLLGNMPGNGFDLHAMAAAAGAGLDAVRTSARILARANLIQRDGENRYRMHDLLHSFAVDQARAAEAEAERVLCRLFDHYLYTAAVAMNEVAPFESRYRPAVAPPRASVPVLLGAESALRWLDTERSTLLALADRAAESGRHQVLTALSRLLYRYLDQGGYYDEGLKLHGLAAAAARDPGVAAAALTDLGVAHVRRGDTTTAGDLLHRALATVRQVDDPLAESRVQNALGLVHSGTGDYRAALACELDSLRLAEKADDRYGRCRTHMNLAVTYQRLGEPDEAHEHAERALELADQDGIVNRVLNIMGYVAMERHRDDEALRCFERALELSKRVGDRAVSGYLVSNIGVILARRGDSAAAAEHQRQARLMARLIGDDALELETLNALGDLARAAGDPETENVHRQDALNTATRVSNEYWQARIHADLARIGDVLGHPEVANHHRARAEELRTRLDLPQV